MEVCCVFAENLFLSKATDIWSAILRNIHNTYAFSRVNRLA